MGAMKARVVAAREAADEARRIESDGCNSAGVTIPPDHAANAAQGNVVALTAHPDLIRDAEWDELIDEGNMKERR